MTVVSCTAGLSGLGMAAAQEVTTVSAPDTVFIFNTLLFLIMGMVVMFMAAGFCMLEAGSVRSKNVAAICLKNIGLYAIASIMVWLVGYNLIYGDSSSGFIGSLAVWAADDATPLENGYSSSSDWFFQMVFVATAASIVSGTLAERIRILPFFIFTAILTGLIYPIQASWQWGEGWLYDFGFSDYAGSTLVHATGGWAALAGAIALGARKGRFCKQGKPQAMFGSSMPLATLGTFILWLGWFGFNGGSALALGTIDKSIEVANVFVNTNMAAAAGVVTVIALSMLLKGTINLPMVLNGAIGGLVSITAEPAAPAVWQAALIGAIGGGLIYATTPLLEKFKIDDVVGAIPAHLVCGIWGTMAVPLSNGDASFVNQFVGILANGVFVFSISFGLWMTLKTTLGIRSTEDEESLGLDLTETGAPGYEINPVIVPAE